MAIIGVASLLLGIALTTASWRSRRLGGDASALMQLSHLRSPTGMPFFPTEDALWNLSGELDEVSGGQRSMERQAR